MGLDAVELVMAVEDAFDVRIEDDEAVKMQTPRDVIDFVWRKVRHADATVCLTQRSFNLLRATLMRHVPLKRRDIKPAALLSELIPKTDRNNLRERIAAELNTGTLPELVRPTWLAALLGLGSIAAGTSVAIALGTTMSVTVAVLLGAAAAVGLGFASASATSGQRCEFPPGIATVGDLSRWIMSHKTDFGGVASDRRWTREQVSQRVREIVVETLGCAGSYREDARFIQDLGMG